MVGRLVLSKNCSQLRDGKLLLLKFNFTFSLTFNATPEVGVQTYQFKAQGLKTVISSVVAGASASQIILFLGDRVENRFFLLYRCTLNELEFRSSVVN